MQVRASFAMDIVFIFFIGARGIAENIAGWEPEPPEGREKKILY